MDRDQEFTAFVAARSARLVHFAQMLCGDAGLAEDMGGADRGTRSQQPRRTSVTRRPAYTGGR